MKKKQIINWTNVLIKASKDIEKYPPFILRDKYNLTQANFYNLCNRFPKLREINNQTFIIVTHNNKLADLADKKIIINDGNVD